MIIIPNQKAYERYWAVNRYYLAQAESVTGQQKQGYLRKAAIARIIAERKLHGANGLDLEFISNRFDISLLQVTADVEEIERKVIEPDLVARVRASLK